MNTYTLGKESKADVIRIELTHEDLTETAADTDQVLEAYAVKPGELVSVLGFELLEAFKDASDAALNSTLLSCGDGADTDHYLTATQVNENGTEVVYKAGTGTRKMYTAADTVDLLVESMVGKSLSNIDTGKCVVLLERFKVAGA